MNNTVIVKVMIMTTKYISLLIHILPIEIRITRPSLTQIEIFYATPGIYISIVPHHYQVFNFFMKDYLLHFMFYSNNGMT